MRGANHSCDGGLVPRGSRGQLRNSHGSNTQYLPKDRGRRAVPARPLVLLHPPSLRLSPPLPQTLHYSQNPGIWPFPQLHTHTPVPDLISSVLSLSIFDFSEPSPRRKGGSSLAYPLPWPSFAHPSLFVPSTFSEVADLMK